jgi:DNA-binding CsgD family transcriptional regulator
MNRVHSEQHLLSLIALIYDAALDPSLWPRFLTRFTDIIHGIGTGMYVQDLQSQQANVNVAVNLDPVYLKEYEDYYAGRNVFIQQGKDRMKPGAVFTGPLLCPTKEVMRSEYYNDCLSQYDLFHPIGAVILQEQSLSSLITSWRPRGAADFGPEDIELLQAVLPHLQRAVKICQRIDGLILERDASAESLDYLPSGVIFTNGRAEVLFVNRAAQAILDACDGLHAGADGLKASVAADTAALRALIGRAAQTTDGTGFHAGGTLAVSRPSLKRPLALLVTPLRAHNQFGIRREPAAVAVFVSDPERVPETNEGLLRRLYSLTPAEAELTAMLVSGLTVSEIADQLGISRSTARWHLKNIFVKTDTRHQSELLRLLLASPVMLKK